MTTNGIENITNLEYAKAILLFILDTYEESDQLIITEQDYNMFSINNTRYLIYSEHELDELIETYNNDLYDSFLDDIPSRITPYIDKDRWLDDNGVPDVFTILEEQNNNVNIFHKYSGYGHVIYEVMYE